MTKKIRNILLASAVLVCGLLPSAASAIGMLPPGAGAAATRTADESEATTVQAAQAPRGFQWDDAAIGAGVAVVLVGAAAAGTVAVRRRMVNA
jgi:hypothetical protein